MDMMSHRVLFAVAVAVLLASYSCRASDYAPGDVIPEPALSGIDVTAFFCEEEIDDSVFARMDGLSFKEGCVVPREELRYLTVLHKDAEGRTIVGEIVCNRKIAPALLDIFRELYDASYPIERVRLVDCYGADDEKSMEADNSSSFNFRVVPNSTHLSYHAYGLAIDINPFYNPYYKKYKDGRELLQPDGSRPYLDRTRKFPYKIDADDLCVRLFKKHGFEWGGDWSTCKDYQHFELSH